MRVLLLNTTFRQEGPTNTLVEVAKGARSEGIDVWVGGLGGPGPVEETCGRFGIPTVRFGGVGGLARLARFVRDGKVHVLCAQLLRGEVVGALATRRSGCRFVCTVQNEDPYRIVTRNPPKALLSRWALRHAQRVVVVSHALRSFVVRHQGVRDEVVEVIPNAVEPVASPAGCATWPQAMPRGNPLIGCVGRLSAQKGQEVLIAAFHRLVHALPEARLVLIGAGPREWVLRRAASRGEGRSRIHFLGWQPSVRPYLACLDLYVQPSFWEGMPFATLEAMASGLPVIASAVGGLPELVGGCGVVVPPGDSEALANAIRELWQAPDLRATLGVRGRERVEREYRADEMSRAYVRVFRSVACDGG